MATLPVGATSIYDDGTGATTLFVVSFGAGRIGFLGFDWFELPTPADWETVLGSSVNYVAGDDAPTAVPEPASFVLIAGGLGLLALRNRRQSISR